MVFVEMQLGKNGLTDNFIQTLKFNFERHDNVRISILKSAGHEREKIKEYSEKILDKLGDNYTARLIGFKIIIKKWRKAKR
jgi:RNA-binding protein YhbY